MIKDQHREELIEIPNPLTEVKSVNGMRQYLGYDVPVMLEKDVDKCYVIGTGKYANHARIIYTDKSQFDMEKGITDPSGIYGGEKKTDERISGVKIEIYTYEDLIYAVWTYNDFSYSYSMINADENSLNLELNTLMKAIK